MSDLISAAKNGYHDNLENLISAGTPIEAQDKDNATALYWGACRGHVKICETLLKSGCAIDAQVKWGSSALHAASDRGHLKCVKILISWGANVNLKNNRGDTPLHLAAYRGFADIVDAFICANADPFIQNEACKTPIQEAQCQQHTLSAYKLQQYMTSLQGCSSLSSFSSGYMKTFHAPESTSYIQKSNHSFIPNIQDNYHGTSNGVNNLSTAKMSSRIPDPGCPGMLSIGSANRRSIEPQENSDSSSGKVAAGEMVGKVNGQGRRESQVNGSYLLQTPLHDYQPIVQESKTPSKMTLSRSQSSQEGRVVLENFAESLQMELVKYSEKVLMLEHGNTELKNRVTEMEMLNSELKHELHGTKEQLAKERRKNFEVVKQQKLLSRSMSSSVPESRKMTSRTTGHSVTHEHLLKVVKSQDSSGAMCNNSFMLDNLQKHLDAVWLQPCNAPMQDANREWFAGVDYDIVGDGPLNHLDDGVRSGSCSLVFQIRRNGTLYILKMMINLINLHYTKHDQGCSLDGYLIRNFGPEYHVPLLLSKHRNIVNVVHYFQGSTDKFRKFQNLLVPSNLDVPIEMATRTSFLVLESYPQTLLSFMVNQRTICPEPCYGLPNAFLLLILYQMLAVIDYLQCNHIVHRDVKGDNVFLDRCLRPVLADFGFARSLHTPSGEKQMFKDKSQSCAGNSSAWAPELTRLHHYGPESLPRLTSLQEIYAKSDGFAVSRMFYSLLRPLGDNDDFPQSSVNVPHYLDSSIPDLPSGFSPGLRDILRLLVLDNPQHRPTARRAMLRIGVLLFAPAPGEVESFGDVTPYLQARALKLLAIHKPSCDPDKVLNVEESIAAVTPEVEASFLVNLTTQEFWEEYVDLKEKHLIPKTWKCNNI